MPKKSVSSALASISKQAKHHLLTPKSKPKRGGGRRRPRRSRDSAASSSASSDDEASSVSSELSDSDFSSSGSEESRWERRSRGRPDRGRRHHRDKDDRRHHERSKRRERGRNERRRHSPDSYGEYAPQRQLPHPPENDAAQMIDLLMRILPFYGKGDGHSDAIVIDTIRRLPPHALEMQDSEGNSLLLLASQNGAFDLLPQLLAKGCDANARNAVGASCLHFACFVDTFSPEAALMLVRQGAAAEVAEHEFGCTPLHWAAFSGHLELCATLCRAGARTTTLDKNGCDPVHYSKQNGHAACTRLLVSFAAGSHAGAAVSAGALSPGAAAEQAEWVRCLDGSTGSSFYHNRDTGESLWGEDFRQADKAGAPSVLGLSSPEQGEAKDTSTDDTKDEVVSLSPASSNAATTAPPAVAPRKSAGATLTAIAEDLDEAASQEQVAPKLVTCPPAPLQGKPETPATPGAGTTVTEEKTRTATGLSLPSTPGAVSAVLEEEAFTATGLPARPVKVAPTLDTLPHACEPPPDEEPHLADIVGDLVETSSIEDAEPTETTPPDDVSIAKSEDECVKPDTKSMLSRSNSWDADLHAKGEKTTQLSAHQTLNLQEENGGAASNGGIRPSKGSPAVGVPAEHLARNQSFEMRISTLHQRMETQFANRMQHLEDKITQQNLETSLKVDDDASKLKENVAEMACTILQLRTEVGTKDLEILSLKQQIVKAETDKLSQLKGSMHACVGEGNVNEDSRKEELVAAQTRHEQEVDELQDRLAHATAALNTASARQELACDETSSPSPASAKSVLAKSQLGTVDSAALQEDNDVADEGTKSRTQELEILHIKILALEAELKNAQAMHKASLVEVNGHSKAEVRQLKEELQCASSELGSLREQLTEAKIERMELLLAKDEAHSAMENALQKARAAEVKVQEMTEFVKETETLKKANEQLHLTLQEETEKRKVLHNTLEDMKGRIRVYVRVRPLSKTEVKADYVNVLTKEDDRTCVMAGDAATASDVRDWEFDKIFYGSNVDGNTQENVFNDTSLLLTSAVDGFNVCIFAYGQTGSGKTYTMLGSADGGDQGLAPRVAHELFRKLAERESGYDINVSVSMLELYTDKLCDLLASSKNEKEGLGDLKIRLAEHTSSGLVEVDGANTEPVANAEELLEVIDRGTRGRASSSTKMNDESSRSHMIATIVLSLCNRRTGKTVHGKVTLVDLAGSERVSKSGATGQQLKEAQSINKSLSALGDVIGALTTGGRQHIPYRNHPLTMLMSDSIGGNAKTLMFVCCSPADYNRKETANSLDFAKRCRNVKNNAVTSKGAAGSVAGSNVSQIRALRKELSKIKEREKGAGAVKRRPIRRPGM